MDFIKSIVKNRIVYLGILLLVAMGLLTYRLYVLQIKESDEYSDDASVYNTYNLPIDAPRGNIYDRNGVLLATNRTAYKLYMINTNDTQEYRDDMYLRLVELMDENEDTYYNYLEDYIVYPIAFGEKIDEEDEADNKKAWINSIVTKKSDKEYFETAESAFKYLRETVFEISADYTDEQAYKIMIFRYSAYMYGLDSFKPTCFATDVCKETVDAIICATQMYKGVTSEKTYFRVYVNNSTLGPVIGYVRAISEEEYEEKKDLGYFADDVIGKLGIEKAAEDDLRGTRGYRVYKKDSDGNVIEGEYVAPIPGNDVYLTIDAELQQNVYDSIVKNVERVANIKGDGSNHGDCDAAAGVVSDVNTGEILAMVNYPTYDNSIFVQPVTDEDAQAAITALFQDEQAASLNRCTQGTYPIGSMIKPVIGIAGLEEGVTDSSREIYCPGYIIAAGKKQKCLSIHGNQNLRYAIAHSCNTYFATIGIEVGIENVDKWIKAFGLGEYTGIEITETKGYRSNPETMDIFEAGTFHKWSDASTAATSIGQLYTTFTPLQVNRYVAAIGNGGYLNEMHLIKKVVSYDGTLVRETEIKQTKIPVSDSNLAIIQDAMTKMVESYGDLQSYMRDYPFYFLAGKTGTAQTGTNEESSHAFYMCYAPYNDPQIAITLMLEHGAYSGNNFYTVKDICNSYFGGSYYDGYVGEQGMYNNSTKTLGSGLKLGRWFNR